MPRAHSAGKQASCRSSGSVGRGRWSELLYVCDSRARSSRGGSSVPGCFRGPNRRLDCEGIEIHTHSRALTQRRITIPTRASACNGKKGGVSNRQASRVIRLVRAGPHRLTLEKIRDDIRQVSPDVPMRHHVPARRAVRRPVVVGADDKVGRKADDEQGEEPPEEAEPARDRVARALAVVLIVVVVALIWRRSLVVLTPAAVLRGRACGRGRPGEVEDAGLGIVVVDGRFRLRVALTVRARSYSRSCPARRAPFWRLRRRSCRS